MAELKAQGEGPSTCCADEPFGSGSAAVSPANREVRVLTFGVKGMTCASCAGRVENALSQIHGVLAVRVDLPRGQATVSLGEHDVDQETLRQAVAKAGYEYLDSPQEPEALDCCALPGEPGLARGWRAYLVGLAAALAVLGFYLGLSTLTSSWQFALVQFSAYLWWLFALSLGLGVQATLYTLFRATLRERARRSARKALAASGGISGLAMAACCSHYLAAFLPAIGLPFLSGAAAALEEYQNWFFLAGVLSNLFGIWLMLHMMARHGMLKERSWLTRLPLGLSGAGH